MTTSRRWSDELSTKLRLFLVEQGDSADDDTSMFVWAKDPEEAHRLWQASAILLQWPIEGGGAYVRQVPVDAPKQASIVEWERVPYFFVYIAQNGATVVLSKPGRDEVLRRI